MATNRRFEIYYEAAVSKVKRQDAWNRDLESKASRYSGVAVAVIGLTIAIVQQDYEGMDGWRICVAALSAVSFLVTVISSLYVLRSRDFRNTPNLTRFSELLEEQKSKGKNAWVRWAGDEYRQAYEHNRKILNKKGRGIVVCELSTAATIVLSLFVAAIAVFGL